VRDVEPTEGVTFGTLLKTTRKARGMTQDELIESSGVSRATILRWEKGARHQAIDPLLVRQACRALDLDPREAAIALGLLTREELGLPPAAAPVDVALEPAARLLADPQIPDAAKAQLRTVLESAVTFWYEQLGVRRPAQRSTKR
jgi:transcriptional regulator with XRE-family HTH domain